jgi:glycosyltransferase involved in cell wall biosynthesis
VTRGFKGRVPIACLFDNQWVGALKQRVIIVWPLRSILKLRFDKLVVAGPHQFCYGRMLGFESRDMILNLCSADTTHFGKGYESVRARKAQNVPHRFLYIGRFSPEKGCDLLIGAFDELCRSRAIDWELVLIGNDPLPSVEHNKQIVVKPLMGKEGLAREIVDAGVFCMPSHREAWGVAIHEAAVAGLPLLGRQAMGSWHRHVHFRPCATDVVERSGNARFQSLE